MSFNALPNEILCSLPLYIDNIETFINARATCRRLRDAFDRTHTNIILQLADASAPKFFSPHPHFLIAVTARQVSDWALGDEERTMKLREAFRGGMDSLYDFCLRHSGLTLDRIRQTYLSRFSIINPFIDKIAEDRRMSTPNLGDGEASDADTIRTLYTRQAFRILIYGELFGYSMVAGLEPENDLPYFDIDMRLEYCKYIVSD